MDKKPLLIKYLARILKNHLAGIDDLVRRYPQAEVQFKQDGSPVTELDLFLSSHIELIMQDNYPEATFYSEEKFDEWKFPLVALDPLDGTREYIEGRDEWAISVGLFQSENFEGEGWVYNPKCSEEFTQDVVPYEFHTKSSYLGEVSRSEYNKQLFQRFYDEGKFVIKPVGSIAYKLARLAYQNSDFVVSLRPKNIWDIAGGTLICKKAGLKFYSQGKEVTTVQKLYEPPLIWCHEELFSELSKIFP